MRWSVSQMAKAWNVRHGFSALRKIIKLGNITNSQGAFLNTIDVIKKWKPGKEEYLNIIELGKIADGLWTAKQVFNDSVINDTPFALVAEHFKQIVLNDSMGNFKLIHSPLFKLASHADLSEWPLLASHIVKLYPYNEVSDPWPKECAVFENCAGQKGFYDVWATLKEIISNLSSDSLCKGCQVLSDDLYLLGGRECLDELYVHDWIRSTDSGEILIGKKGLEKTAIRKSIDRPKYFCKPDGRKNIYTHKAANKEELRKLVSASGF